MRNNNYLAPLATLTVAALAVNATPCQAAQKKKSSKSEKPNVIVLFTDQHRADIFSHTGHPDVQTPNFDKMAQEGISFRRAYSQDAVSGPSRTCMFTGLYPRTTGQMDNPPVVTDPLTNAVSLQASFQANGYTTYAFGKRHLHSGADDGWSVIKSHAKNEASKDGEHYVKWIEEQGYAQEFGEDWAAEFGKFPPGNSLANTPFPTAPMGTRTTKLPEDYTMEAYSTQNTLEVMRKHAKSGEPFFCFTSFYRPHQPYNPLPKYLAAHDTSKWGEGRNNGSSVAMPKTLREPADHLTPFMTDLRSNTKSIWCLGNAAEDEQLYRDYIVAYYALVEEIDHHVGVIFEELEKLGMADNTIVVYTSDHGEFVGNHGMIEKAAAGQNVYEETIRVPMIFYWKDKIKGGQINEDLVEMIDIYPTLMDLTGSTTPQMENPLEGQSLSPALLKGKSVGRDYIVTENWYQATVVTKDAKLGMWLDPSAMYKNRDWRSTTNFYFDMTKDYDEVNNIYQEMKDSDEVKKLESYYQEFVSKHPGAGKQQWTDVLNARKAAAKKNKK